MKERVGFYTSWIVFRVFNLGLPFRAIIRLPLAGGPPVDIGLLSNPRLGELARVPLIEL